MKLVHSPPAAMAPCLSGSPYHKAPALAHLYRMRHEWCGKSKLGARSKFVLSVDKSGELHCLRARYEQTPCRGGFASNLFTLSLDVSKEPISPRH